MEPIVHRNREARRAVVVSAALLLWSAISLARLLRGAEPDFLLALGLAWPMVVSFVLRVSLGRTTVDERGIHARRLFSRRMYAWHDISDITVEERTSRGHGAHRIVISRPGRRPRLLPAPYVDIRASHTWYEELLTQAEDLRARLRAAREAEGGTEAARNTTDTTTPPANV